MDDPTDRGFVQFLHDGRMKGPAPAGGHDGVGVGVGVRPKPLVFAVPVEMVGFLIGKNGTNISRVCKKFNVEVNVSASNGGDGLREITIQGAMEDKMPQAREELEYLEAE